MWNGASGLENAVGELERLAERLRFEERAVARRMHVREIENGSHPVEAARDLDDVVHRAEIADAPHHLDPERHRAILRLEPLAQRAELLDDRVDRIVAFRPSRKPGWKTTSSAPLAATIPALRSSAPTADVNLRPLASRCPMKPKSGACTESAMSFSRASSPRRSANG